MTDTWFIQDVENYLKRYNRIVILDPKCQWGFLLALLQQKGYNLIITDSELTEEWETVKEELFLRQQIETIHKNNPVVIYITRELKHVSFLFDYCFTYGCIDFSNPTEWLRKMLFATTGLQVQLDNSLLLTAAKLGVGKDMAWWKRILQNLQELISMDEELVPFLDNPEDYSSSKDPDIYRLFEEKLFELLGHPYLTKSPHILADEIVKKIFDGLVSGELTQQLLDLYYHWVDSDTYRPSLEHYIKNYKIDSKINPWSAHPDHCFSALDERALKMLLVNIRDKSAVENNLHLINARANRWKVQRFIPSWWKDIVTLLSFNSKPLATCTQFHKLIPFYTEYFSKVDRAMRNLYATFLQEESIIRPLQEYYENFNHELLEQWFSVAEEYKPDQQGFLPNLFNTKLPGIAVIVGDGIRYEIADYVATSLAKILKVDKQVMLAGIPSETENNMSGLYVSNHLVLPLHRDREKSLTATTGKKITYMNLEAFHSGIKVDYLVLTYKDIDDTGEKLQHGAIKLFTEFEQVLKDKISLILNSGYKEVHLITDHGFVLTGLLDESDKIEPHITGKKEVHERYILTANKQDNKDLIGFQNPYGEFNYVYVSKNHRPFKSRGVYGYSHGGLTPQEVIIPKFSFQKLKEVSPALEIGIINRKELEEVTGELFGIRLQAGSAGGDLFASSRKVQVYLYAKGERYSSSNIVNIEAGNTEALEFSFSGHSEVQAVVVDVTTQEQLDSAIIKKSNLRDLGGLM